MFDKLELAWAAGFFDGEGSVCPHRKIITRGEKTWDYSNVRLLVSQSGDHAPKILSRFARAVGIEGHVYGPYRDKRPGARRKPAYQFHVYKTRDVHAVINRLWPWLSPAKREQAREALGQEAVPCD